MGYLTWWNFPKKAWLIIIGELWVIASLSAWLYATYINDVYFQSYTNGLASVLVPVLSIAFGIFSASLATYLYLGMKRIRVSEVPETPRRVAHTKRTGKRASQHSTAGAKEG